MQDGDFFLKIAITDDMEFDRKNLKELIMKFLRENSVEAELFEYSSAEDFLKSFRPGFFNLVFLDIYMDNINGIEAAKRVYDTDKNCRIIFLTTANCFAPESYDVNAVYYMIKPPSEEKLFSVIKKCMGDMISESKRLCVMSKRASVQIPFSSILYADVSVRTVRIHLADRIVNADRGFYNVAAPLLEDDRFIECYKGVVVNIEHIKKQIDDDFILDNGERIPISKRKKKELVRLFMEYEFRSV